MTRLMRACLHVVRTLSVRDDDALAPLTHAQLPQCLGPVLCRVALVPELLEQPDHELAGKLVVVHDQNPQRRDGR